MKTIKLNKGNKRFFKLTNYFPNWKEQLLNKICVINGGRNVGKSYNLLELMSEFFDEMNKFLYLRINDTKAKIAAAQFNQNWHGKFQVASTGFVYRCEYDEKKDRVYPLKDQVVGFIGSIRQYNNVKSLQFSNLRFVLFDEYNESISTSEDYAAFVNILTTFQRFSDIYTFLIGNRDSANNQFMVAFDLLLADDYTFTTIQTINDYDDPTSEPIGYFVELGSDDFSELDNSSRLATKLSRLSDITRKYQDGSGYAYDTTRLVVPYRRIIKPTAKPLFSLFFAGKRFVLGKFTKPNGKIGFFISTQYKDKFKGAIISIDKFGELFDITQADDETKFRIVELIKQHLKSNNLYFSSFEHYLLWTQLGISNYNKREQ